MRSNISSPITTTTSPRPMCRAPIPISRKDASINEQIDRMRHSATRALLERRDVVIVASVSCIYGIGSPETYSAMTLRLEARKAVEQRTLLKKLVELQYRRNDQSFERGDFRVRGDLVEIFPAHSKTAPGGMSLFGDDDRGSIRRVRSADRRQDRRAGPSESTQQPLRDAAPDHAAGRQEHPRRPRPAPRGIPSHRPIARGRAPGTAHLVRFGDDGGDRPAAPASRIIRAISPGATPASRRRPCSNICPRPRSWWSMRAMSPCRS